MKRLFVASFILASKLSFVNLLSSGIVIKLVASGTLFSISVAFLLMAALVGRLVKTGILFSICVAFLLRVAVVTKLVKSLSVIFGF